MRTACHNIIHKFKVEREDQGLAHAPVGKKWITGVHDKTGDPTGLSVLNFGLQDVASLYAGVVISRVPFVGVVFTHNIEDARFERFFQNGVIRKELNTNFVQVGFATLQRQIAAPIVGIALERDIAVWLIVTNHIGCRPDWRDIKARLIKCASFPLRFLEYWTQPGDQGQLAIGCVECDPKRAWPRSGQAFNL